MDILNIPEEIRAARIGTCYNAFTRKLMHTRNAIDPQKLEENMLLFISGTSNLDLRANSSSTKNIQESFFALDSKAKIGPWATASYNMSLASSETDSSSHLSCYCSYVYKNQKLQLMDLEPDTLFNCMTDEFQKAYTDVVTADKEQALEKYLAFVNKFGYGCVTGLHLCAGSAFVISADHVSTAKALEDKYNASAGIGFSAGGASVATNYAKKEASADSSATVKIVMEEYPENTPTSQWCNQYQTALGGIAFKELSEKAQTITAYSGEAPKAPEIPAGKKDQKELPAKKAPEIGEEVQKELMKEDGFKGSWEEYVKKQEEILKTIKPEKVVEQASNRLQENLAYDLDKLPPIKTTDAAKDVTAWNLGGYAPHHVDFKLWSELFPALPDIQIPETSFNPLYLAKVYMYYLTRLQFVSYFKLLYDIGVTAYTKQAQADIVNCESVCADLLHRITQYLKQGEPFDEELYDGLVASFEQGLLTQEHFHGKYLYTRFFQYYDFSQSNMSGFAGILHFNKTSEKYYISKDWENEEYADGDLNIQLFMKDCLRWYPVFIEGEGDEDYIALYGYDRKEQKWKRPIITFNKNFSEFIKPETDAYGYTYYWVLSPFSWTKLLSGELHCYGVDEKTLRLLEKIPLAGLPMIPPLNYEDLYFFLGIEV